MNVSPERAQEMFVRDLIPDLHGDGSFVAYVEEPGEVRLTDELMSNGFPSLARHALAHRLKVRFDADGPGTRVHISGSAHNDVRTGLQCFGTPGHWPETADAPHD